MKSYHLTRTVGLPIGDAIDRTIATLRDEGFELQTEVDLQTTVKTQLGIDIAPYRILGFCNPHFAYQALMIESRVGTLLPCSVVFRTVDDARTEISSINPEVLMAVVENDELTELARDATRCLNRGLDMVGAVVDA